MSEHRPKPDVLEKDRCCAGTSDVCHPPTFSERIPDGAAEATAINRPEQIGGE